jgi:hypothetical protein
LPDGTSGNAAPQVERVQGTAANPKFHAVVLRFDPATEEMAYWTGQLPHEAAASPTFTLRLLWASIAAITSTNVVWGADTPIEHAQAAQQTVTSANNTTEAGRAIAASITFTNAQADGITADDWLVVQISRVAANASDTLAEDARLLSAALTFDLA